MGAKPNEIKTTNAFKLYCKVKSLTAARGEIFTEEKEQLKNYIVK